ncbi:MAG: hypothetical protein QOF51_3768 [Chloroflexota bacterium]|nr:hypothetical protein [Chloroflexota bacterium]
MTAQAPPKTCQILVVDDDPTILAVVSEILELEGYRVETATNGAEALQVLDRAAPSLVLLDMRMPVLDGWGFAEQIKDRVAKPKIAVMTAAQDAQGWAKEIGADGYLAKPFEIDDLVNVVERLCGAA